MEELNESIEVARLIQEVMGLFKHSMAKIFGDTGITAPQSMVIGILSTQKKMKISELSSRLSLSNSTVSGIIDRLEKQGMVERERSEVDKRVVYVNISPQFYGMHQNFHKQMEENIAQVMSKGTPQELNKIIDGLSMLKKLLELNKNE